MSERSILVLLEDIQEAINNILEFTKGFTLELYSSDVKTRHAVEHNFMIIGEVVTRIPEEYKLRHSSINWRQIKAFRNILVHDYFGIDQSIVWDIIQFHLLELLQQIVVLIEEER